jgi:hypothetical protein
VKGWKGHIQSDSCSAKRPKVERQIRLNGKGIMQRQNRCLQRRLCYEPKQVVLVDNGGFVDDKSLGFSDQNKLFWLENSRELVTTEQV